MLRLFELLKKDSLPPAFMRGVPEGRGESEYFRRKYSGKPIFLRKAGTPSDLATLGHLPHKWGEASFLCYAKSIVGISSPEKTKRTETRRFPFWYARRDSFAFSPGNGRKQMCGSVEPSPAALIPAAF